MKRARREERRRESGGRGRTQRNGERKKKKGKLERYGTCHQVSWNIFRQHDPFYMQSNSGHMVQTGSVSRKNIYFKVKSETNKNFV